MAPDTLPANIRYDLTVFTFQVVLPDVLAMAELIGPPVLRLENHNTQGHSGIDQCSGVPCALNSPSKHGPYLIPRSLNMTDHWLISLLSCLFSFLISHYFTHHYYSNSDSVACSLRTTASSDVVVLATSVTSQNQRVQNIKQCEIDQVSTTLTFLFLESK